MIRRQTHTIDPLFHFWREIFIFRFPLICTDDQQNLPLQILRRDIGKSIVNIFLDRISKSFLQELVNEKIIASRCKNNIIKPVGVVPCNHNPADRRTFRVIHRNKFPDKQGAKAIEKQPQQNTAAIGLYRAYGFSEAGIRKKYYRDPEDDAIVMLKGFRAYEQEF